ncbi:hypothetical protein BB8028_0005g06790 [Beauveria bassiana]|uniref:Uncharacterized protein n=1 Tax=Beauveria bassiana TaxID=176275 RepID=A0A2S7YG62_BEABA|nr:hypothetical protein BB8028_0005g06790 [Beauveria bassiana]
MVHHTTAPLRRPATISHMVSVMPRLTRCPAPTRPRRCPRACMKRAPDSKTSTLAEVKARESKRVTMSARAIKKSRIPL